MSGLRRLPRRAQSDLTKSIFLALWGGALLCVLLQLFIGADIVVVVTDFASVTLGLFIFRMYGIFNSAATLLLFYSIGNVILALFVKTILLQPVDLYLFAPQDSYLAELTMITAAVLALLVAGKLEMGAPILPPEYDAQKLRRLARLATLFGLAAWWESHHYHATSGGSFDGFAGFRDLLFLAVICKTGSLLVRGSSGTYLDVELAVLLIVSMSLGFLINSKTYTFLPLIGYVSTIFFFEGRISLTMSAIFAAIGGLFLTVISPLIQAFRFLGQAQVPFFERINLIATALTSHRYAVLLQRLRANASSLYGEGYYDYFRDQANWVVIVGRYASVQQIDPVIARVQIWGFQKLPVFSNAVAAAVPHVLDHAKLSLSTSYYILLQLGFVSLAAGKFPTLPMAGELYACNGLVEVLLGGFAVFLGFFLVLKKLNWDLRRNVFAIFFFVDFTFVYAGQGSVEQYLIAALRQFPTYAAIIWLLRRLIMFGALRPEMQPPDVRPLTGENAD